MKILIYGINFSPELTGIGKYTGEMAEYIASKGHDVRVITAPPYYPGWKVESGYKSYWYTTQFLEGALVHRAPIWVPRQPSGIKRVLHLLSFAFASLPVLIKQLFWKPDLIFVVEPPLVCAPLALIAGAIVRAKTWLHIQDFEVDAAFKMGLLKSSFLKKALFRMEKAVLHNFDQISSISNSMVRLSREKGVAPERSYYFPNWADSLLKQPHSANNFFQALLKIPSRNIIALYSGNMGNKQGLETLVDVAKLSAHAERFSAVPITFIFCGNGAGRQSFEAACKGMTNVKFLDLQPRQRFHELLAYADIHLVPQKADAADLVLPSKINGIMASGRPVVVGAEADTELATVITREAMCGIAVKPEDSSAFAAALFELAGDSQLRHKLGENGRRYAVERLSKSFILDAFLERAASL